MVCIEPGAAVSDRTEREPNDLPDQANEVSGAFAARRHLARGRDDDHTTFLKRECRARIYG